MEENGGRHVGKTVGRGGLGGPDDATNNYVYKNNF